MQRQQVAIMRGIQEKKSQIPWGKRREEELVVLSYMAIKTNSIICPFLQMGPEASPTSLTQLVFFLSLSLSLDIFSGI